MEKRDIVLVSKAVGDDATLFVSRYVEDSDTYRVSIVKNKYASNEKLQKWDILILNGQKLKELAEWVVGLKKENLPSKGHFFDKEKNCVLECQCLSELLVTYYDAEADDVYIEIFDNYWLKRKYHRKLSHSFSSKREKAQQFFISFLNILPKAHI